MGEQDANAMTHLETLFLRAATAILEQIAAGMKPEDIPVIPYPQTIFQSASSWTRQIVGYKNYQQVADRYKDHFLQLETVQACAATHHAAGVLELSPPVDPSSTLTPAQLNQLGEYLWYPLMDTLQRYDTLKPTQEQLLESYRRFREAWTATTVRQNAIIPLLNFRAEGLTLPIGISSHYELAPLSLEEKTAFWSRVDAFQGWDLLPFRSFLAAEFRLQGSRTHPRMHQNATEQMIAEFSRSHIEMLYEVRNIVTALRLLHPGDVAVTAYIEESNEVPPFGGNPSMGIPGAGLSDFQVRRHGFLSPYTLQDADVPLVRSLVEKLHQLDTREHRGGVEIALSRFNQSYVRDSLEDRLIDLTIALESCLLAGLDSKTELKYRFTLRGTALLAQQSQPQEVSRKLSALYDARSAIVHSGQYLSQQKSKQLLNQQPAAFVQTCEDLTRTLVRAYIEALTQAGGQGTIIDINKTLEQRILRGLGNAHQ